MFLNVEIFWEDYEGVVCYLFLFFLSRFVELNYIKY